MYAAEAMIQLGRIQEAISHLSPDNISGISNNASSDHITGLCFFSCMLQSILFNFSLKCSGFRSEVRKFVAKFKSSQVCEQSF